MSKEILFEAWSSDSKIQIVKKRNSNGRGKGKSNQYFIFKFRQDKHNMSTKISRTTVDLLLELDEKGTIQYCFRILLRKNNNNRCIIGRKQKHADHPLAY